jgi:hypothetical protein
MAYDATTTPATSSAFALAIDNAINFQFGGRGNKIGGSAATATPTSTATASAAGSAYSAPVGYGTTSGGKMSLTNILLFVAVGYLVYKQLKP